ncbi:sensor histidine kinase [Actinomadura macrotermitis]|uniref:histidine kinase n=1 Tax=Actinomadura macrotermitis TaxID=2585200 RepID=A0A7K0BMN0_9ACTN|nr:HAMP domain-containing sensor histidine kinase [Actinomadura macrotermitis]MQY02132.1 Adaptive-response sensory-kinase SasA [Actinomadura macrotermitis]
MNVTIRLRFALLYGGLFLVTGLALLALNYVLFRNYLRHNSAPTWFKPLLVGYNSEPFRRTVDRRAAEYQADALGSLLTQGTTALALVVIAAFGLAWLVAGRALRPVHQVTETARRVAHSSDLSERIAHHGPADDIKELADTFDGMLARLAHAFESQRRFVANASHELRTPLTINRTLIDVATRRADAGDDIKQLGAALLESNRDLEQLIEGLLTLADSEHSVLDKTPLDLADVTEHTLKQKSPEADEARVALHRTLPPAVAAADPVLLERLVQNLVENAIRHNRPGGELWVTTEATGDHVRFTIANTGPVVAAHETASLFEPFHRLATDRSGHGLGLSIVRAIAHAHDGTVRAEPKDGGGLTVTVGLPAAEAVLAPAHRRRS